ncbi:MAG: hypothetical protein OEW08_13615, partial [Gammaproteobacteria bacterium]|nr:hypothetical protein [Gammaproteobacteria bacterium]
GTTLYIATDVGIKKIASIDTAPVVSDVFLTNPVKALTLDSTNSKLYYLAPSLIKANTDAIYELNLASPTSAVAVQDYLYGAKNLQFASGALHWRTALQAYSLNLATSALSLRVRDAYSVSAFAADSSGGVFLQIGSVPGPIYLPAQYAYAATAPSAITATYVYQYDQYLQISWGTVPGADAVSVTANGTTQIVAVPTTTTNILGLTNNTAYPVSIVPLNATGAGVATNNTGTPVVAAPYNIVAVPQAGQIRFDITANSNAMRNLTMNVYGSATMPVDTSTSATPLASATASFTAGSATNSITYATANDNILYYNATLIEGATGSVSAAKYAASAESWTNSAAAATQVSGANVPAIDTPTNLGSVNAYVYWTNAGGVADTVYRSNTAGTLPHSEAVTALNALDILASDGASLYGYDTGLNKVYAVNNANNATATNVTMTEILSTTLLTAFNSAPTSLAVSVGTLYVGAANGNIYAVDWNGTAASNQRLIWSTGGGYVCELTTLGSDLYWVQDYTTGFGCAGTGYSSNYSTRIRRGLSDGTGVVDDLVTVPYYRVTHIQTALVSLQPYLYYSTPSDNKIHRMNLTTLATDTPVSEIVRGYFAVNPTTGKLYYTDNTVIGVAFTLDAQNRKTAHKTGGGTSTGISLLNINATPKLYLYGDAAAGLFEALP